MNWKRLSAAGAAAAWVAVRRHRRKIRLDGKVVLITGASRGLGLELARAFGRHGARLALLARDADELRKAVSELAGLSVLTLACDVRDAADVARAVGRTRATWGAVDVLVNAAGVIDVAPFEHLEPADYRDSLDTHLWGPLHMVRAVAGGMQPGGRIVNVSSIGGLVSVPHLLSYSVGKFALTGLSEGLHAELARRGIRVTTVCPGLMRTGSHVNARFKGRRRQEFAWFAAAAGFPLASMSARRAARKIVAACRAGKPFLILTPQARILHLVHALAPNTTAAAMRAAAHLLPAPGGGDRKSEGWESTSRFAPSVLTRLADRAIDRNNQLDARRRSAYLRDGKASR